MGRRSGSLALAVVLWLGVVASSLSVGQCQELQVAQDAEAILRQVSAKYSSLDSYQGKVTATRSAVGDGQTQVLKMIVTIALQRPNRFSGRFEVTHPAGVHAWDVTCDGETCWTYLPSTNKYLAEDAAGGFQQLIYGSAGSEAATEVMLPEGRRIAFGLFADDPYTTLMEGMKSAELVGMEQTGRGPANHIALRSERSETDIWVSKEDSSLIQAKLTPRKLLEQAKASGSGLRELSVEIALEPSAAASPVLPGTFAFEPPAGAQSAQDLGDLITPILKGKPFIDLALEGLQEGTSWHLADHKGEVIAVGFWATWCPPCRAELPKLQEIYRDYKDKGLLLLAVNVSDDRQKTAAFLKETGLDVPVALDTGGKASRAYFVTGIPMLMLIGRDGTIQAVHRGYKPGDEKTIRAEIEKLLAGQPLGEQKNR